MQVSVTFRKIDASDTLRNYAQEKLYRIRKYVEDPIEAHVVLSVEKFRPHRRGKHQCQWPPD